MRGQTKARVIGARLGVSLHGRLAVPWVEGVKFAPFVSPVFAPQRKATMKLAGIVGTALIAVVMNAGAIEQLHLSEQCSNIVLRWPSVAGDTYAIRYRPDLSTNSSWTILTNGFPASSATNWTIFVHTNAILNPVCGPPPSGGTTGTNKPPPPPKPSSTQSSTLSSTSTSTQGSPPTSAPLPWDPKWQARGNTSTSEGSASPTGFAGVNGGGGNCGFYEVVKVGIHLWGVTNGMVLRGTVPLKFEFANGDTNGVLNGFWLWDTNLDGAVSGVTTASIETVSNKLCGTWDTTQLPNGTYTIQAQATTTGGVDYADHPVTVTINNLIWLADSWNEFGTAIYVGVQTVFTSGTWHLDVYDQTGTGIGSLDGTISVGGWLSLPGYGNQGFSLNNTDANGNQLPATAYTLVYTLANAAPQKASPPPPYVFTNSQTTELQWNFQPTYSTLIYEDVFGSFYSSAQKQEIAMFQDFYPHETAWHPSEIGDINYPFIVGIMGDWNAVIRNGLLGGALGTPGECRDFFYFGHGGPNSLGGNPTQPSGSLAVASSAQIVTSTQVMTNLANDPNGINGRIATPYRFVFLDGCNTDGGNWPEAFGIQKKKNMTSADFIKKGLRPRAFVGWKKTVAIGSAKYDFMDQKHLDFIHTFWATWESINPVTAQAYTLQDAINTASSTNSAGNGIVIYGATDLTIIQ